MGGQGFKMLRTASRPPRLLCFPHGSDTIEEISVPLSADQLLLESGWLCGLLGAGPVVTLSSESGLAVSVVLDPCHCLLQLLP